MFSVNIALLLLVVFAAFIAAWRTVPSGWLTAATGSLGAVVIALHEAMGDLMPELKAMMPPEHRSLLVILFLLLTVAARFRKRVVEP